jgi:hypothetical protein
VAPASEAEGVLPSSAAAAHPSSGSAAEAVVPVTATGETRSSFGAGIGVIESLVSMHQVVLLELSFRSGRRPVPKYVEADLPTAHDM